MIITKENFLITAMHYYDNPQCFSVDEFSEDLKRFTYLKKLLYRYKNNSELCERIILNHIIVIYNLFGNIATELLFFKLEEELWPYLITFLIYLNRLPDNKLSIPIVNYPLDELIVERLRKL